MTYIIRNQDQTIKTFLERGDDAKLEKGETMEESPLSFKDYSRRLHLSIGGRSGETLTFTVGSPAPIVIVSCPGEASVDLLINGLSETVALTAGLGEIILSTDVPGTFEITPADRKRYCVGGESSMYVRVL